MTKQHIKSIGTIIPLGDGATGKSLLTKHLLRHPKNLDEANELAKTIKKSLNVEIEFATKTIELKDKIIDTTLQYYVFPGQRQKVSRSAPTFDDIVNTFEFLPALKKVTVLLMIYDTTRIESLKSLEFWLNAALDRGWLHYKMKIILISNKIDLQPADDVFLAKINLGIHDMLKKYNISLDSYQITNRSISAVTLEGLNKLRDEIFEWVSHFGIQSN